MSKNHEAEPSATAVRFEESFARELHRRRELAGMSQSELARLAKAEGLHIWQSAIGRIENGERQVTLNEAFTLASIIGADPAEMADYSPETDSDPLDPAGIATERAQAAARAAFAAVQQAWQKLDAMNTEAREWIDRAVEHEPELVPPNEQGHYQLPAPDAVLAALPRVAQLRARRVSEYVAAIAHLEDMADVLESFLSKHSDDHMRPIVQPAEQER